MASGGSDRTARVEGWSGAPLASRLPAIALVAAVGFGAVVRPAAPFVFVAILVLYLFQRSRGERPAALAAVLPGVDFERGMSFANRIHNSGQALVWSGHRELAELYWEQLNGHGLTMAPLER